MKTSLSATRTNSRRGSPKSRRIITALAIALIGFLILTFIRGGVGAAASFIASPVGAVKVWFLESSSLIPTFFRSQGSLVHEVQSLEYQLMQRTGDAFTLSLLSKENYALREQLGFRTGARHVAGVISRPEQTPYDTLLIDKGSDDGIVEGATVYIHGDIAIGSIARTYGKSSLVHLASSSGVRSTAYIFGPDIFTDAEGMGGGVLRVSVPQGIPLAVGNIVMLPGASAGAYGTVVHVESPESSPQQHGYVTTPVPLGEIRFVSVAERAPASITYEDALAAVSAASTTLFSVSIPESVLVSTSTASTTSTTTP